MLPGYTYTPTMAQSLHLTIAKNSTYNYVGIEWHYTPSHSPHSNGSHERNHYTMDRQFKKKVSNAKGKKSLKQSLAEMVFVANTNIRVRTGFSPTHVLFGRTYPTSSSHATI